MRVNHHAGDFVEYPRIYFRQTILVFFGKIYILAVAGHENMKNAYIEVNVCRVPSSGILHRIIW
jgi:hypothetical protein